jgi:hypothetical protein
VTLWPPQACPCGRPRAGGTYVDKDPHEALPWLVLFGHPDGQCEWLREAFDYGRVFRHRFLPWAA